MGNIIKSAFAQFTEEMITFTALVFFLLSCILIIYWLYNRRKFRELSHQIPASVVKNYLDSIIQNSTALKSSLFRGGGLDLGEGIPSIVPVSDLPKGNVQVVDNSAELNSKNAEIGSLKGQLSDKDRIIADLEAQLKSSLSGASAGDGAEEIARLNGEVSTQKDRIAELEAALAAAEAAAANAGGGGGDDAALASITAERDELKERLMEYEIIEEDLANLKRLQQENAELKKALEGGGGATPAPAAESEPAAAPEPEAVAEPEPAPAVEEDPFDAAVAEQEAAEATVPGDGEPEEQKSAEELLSEFEKMLG